MTRIAVFGLGRSGLAVGRAALARGMDATVYDEAVVPGKPELLEEARSLGLKVVTGWDGKLDETPDSVVINPAIPKDHPTLLRLSAEGIPLHSEVEFAYSISRAPIVAITGTNGKSTTTVMTWLALRACGEDAILCGNIYGSGYDEQPLTDAALHATEDQVLVAEISSFQLEWVDRFKPVSAGITNITPDHLNRYESFDEYAATKQRIFACQGDGDFAVVRANDPVVRKPGKEAGGYVPRHLRSIAHEAVADLPRVLTFGATSDDARVEEMEFVVFGERLPWASFPMEAVHDRQNAAMAAMLSYGLLCHKRSPLIEEAISRRTEPVNPYSTRKSPVTDAIPIQILDGLRSYKGLAHRMESVGSRDGIRLVNNSMCTNPDAVVKSTQALKDGAHILMGGVNKDLDFAPLARYLANRRHRVYLFGQDAGDIAKVLGGDPPIFASMEEAFAAAVASARKGEIVVLSPGCASSDQFRDFRHRGDAFRDLAKEWLDR
ncbi:UDP-N-acetylmuramoyl-L-alanine--D-glutamate ligase [bacterium]|nr:MAG: UDP-N-acetylmuramoyl-L-alanine--D-glutamate ligase [bacterium]